MSFDKRPWYVTGAEALRRIKKTDASKLQDEYMKLVEGLQEANDAEDAFVSNPGRFSDDRPRNPAYGANLISIRG